MPVAARTEPRGGTGRAPFFYPFNLTPHPRVVVGADPYGMRTCDARPYGLYIRVMPVEAVHEPPASNPFMLISF